MRYNKCMNAFRRLGFGLATLIFSSLLTTLALFISIYMVLGKPDPLLDALRTSGLYSTVAPTIFDQQAKQKDGEGELALDNPAIRGAVIGAFPPGYLQTTVETNVRSVYAWIHGQTATPKIGADLSAPRALFSKNIGNVVKQKLEGLPVCKNAAATPTTPEELLALTCRPPGVSEAALVESAERQAATSSLFAGTAEQVTTLDGNQQPLSDNLRALPQIYLYFVWSLFIIPVVLALCAAAIIFWAASKRAGLKALGKILITNGIIGVILALGAGWFLSNAGRFIIDQNSTLVAIQTKLIEVLQGLGGQLRNWWLGITIGYVALGLAALFLARTLGRQAKAAHNQALNEAMGYRNDVPTAGTKFDPHAPEAAPGDPTPNKNDSTETANKQKNTTA